MLYDVADRVDNKEANRMEYIFVVYIVAAVIVLCGHIAYSIINKTCSGDHIISAMIFSFVPIVNVGVVLLMMWSYYLYLIGKN